MTPTTLVVLAVVPHEGRYLIVEERDGTFYLPAGRVEPGEDLLSAVVRETREEAGVTIDVRGLLGFDHYASPIARAQQKVRFAFVGAPRLPAPPKAHVDEHSRGARWLRREELAALPLRDGEVIDWIERYERAATLLPADAYAFYGR